MELIRSFNRFFIFQDADFDDDKRINNEDKIEEISNTE